MRYLSKNFLMNGKYDKLGWSFRNLLKRNVISWKVSSEFEISYREIYNGSKNGHSQMEFYKPYQYVCHFFAVQGKTK